MSISAAVQKLVVDTLKADVAVAALVGARVYDQPPSGAMFPYVSIGPSDTVPVSGDCKRLSDETVQIDVWTSNQGRKLTAKRICGAIYDALHEFDGEPEAGALIELRVISVRVFSDQDPAVVHGVVTVTAQMEH